MTNTGYYTSRNQIINWVNDLLITSLTKIEQLGSGAIYCHLLDAAYPEKVPLNKVKWTAYLEVDFIHNFKILQAGFQRLGISKFIDIQKLCKAKYQDNLELIQWIKWHLGPKIKENFYNALARRHYSEINLNFFEGKGFDLKQTLNKETRQLKSTSLQSLPTILSPKYSKIKYSNQNQGFKTLARGSSIKSIIGGKQNTRTGQSNFISNLHSKDYIHAPQVMIKRNPPLLLNKTNIVNIHIMECQDQECF